MNIKKDRVLFVKEVNEILYKYGIFINEENHVFTYRLKSRDNLLTVKLYGEKDHKLVYSVFMKYDRPVEDIGNPYSGKHNFHDSSEDVQQTIDWFESFLLNALHY